ncbi:hypothetical protein ElyMa_003123400 [Elysia marginata]|uniref:Uncharacterized protein n=1 Tax=Elysia marginata TaxID=1093978 RepID=A0AAV4IQV3_9GAST|nr:hypothetical protein ElyMa_003123400 [Elysia marginata]
MIDHHLNAVTLATRLTIASILLTSVMVHGLPLLSYGQDGLQDFPPSSSSSSSSSSASSGARGGSLKDEIAELAGLSPQDEAYLLALAMLVQNNRESHRSRSLFDNKAAAASPLSTGRHCLVCSSLSFYSSSSSSSSSFFFFFFFFFCRDEEVGRGKDFQKFNETALVTWSLMKKKWSFVLKKILKETNGHEMEL